MRWLFSYHIFRARERHINSLVRCWKFAPFRNTARGYSEIRKQINARPLDAFNKDIADDTNLKGTNLPRSESSTSARNPLLYNSRHIEATIILDNESYQKLLLKQIGRADQLTTEDIEITFAVFNNLIDIVSGFRNEIAFQLLCDIWRETFYNETAASNSLQKKLLTKKNIFTHVLINSRNYTLYQQLVEPLINSGSESIKQEWSDTLMSTLQLQYGPNNVITMNSPAIKGFLSNKRIDMLDKRKLLSILLEKGLLYADNPDEKDHFIKKFIEFAVHLGDDEFLFISSKYLSYTSALRLYGSHINFHNVLHEVNKIKGAFMENSIYSHRPFYNFITSIMNAQLPFNPNVVIGFWNYKVSQNKQEVTDMGSLNFHDLNLVMRAYLAKGELDHCLETYQAFSSLHDESQIEILLQLSKQSKNWKLLQKQFEDMYGKGNLPYVVHYAIVMNALASIGATKEVGDLFTQLRKRGLKPNAEIYAALIRCSLRDDDTDTALSYLNTYLEESSESSEARSSKYLYSLIFEIYLRRGDRDALWKTLNEAIEKQASLDLNLVDSNTMSSLVNFYSSKYLFKEVEKVRNLAFELNLFSEDFYSSLMRAYTRLDKFSIAEEICFEAHSNSLVPFKSALIYKSQLRNYRFWYRAEPNKEKRLYIERRMRYIGTHVRGLVTFKSNSGLYGELLKYHLIRRDIDSAEDIINELRGRNLLKESHFIPFLKYYCDLKSYEGYSKVLAQYRVMAKENIKITPRAYNYLMISLLYLDGQNNNGYKNSYSLLQTVFDLNGLTMRKTDISKTPLSDDLYDHTLDLFRMVSNFVAMTTDLKNNNIDLLVHFLDQLRNVLEKNTSIDLKFEIVEKMAKIYQNNGKMDLMEKLVDKSLDEMGRIVSNLNQDQSNDNEVSTPMKLRKVFRRLSNLKYHCLLSRNAPKQEFESLLERSVKNSIRLPGTMYYFIMKKMMPNSDEKSLRLVLHTCEEYLVSGNWVEENMKKMLMKLYKLTIYYLHSVNELPLDQEKLQILNIYYNIQSLKDLEQEFSNSKNLVKTLERELHLFSKEFLHKEVWTIEDVINDIPTFFSPERRLEIRNKISFSSLDLIWNSILTYCGEDKSKAFKLMDDYPETIDLLLYNSAARFRLQKFRDKIDRIKPPSKGDQKEDYESRKHRTIEALAPLKLIAPSSLNLHHS